MSKIQNVKYRQMQNVNKIVIAIMLLAIFILHSKHSFCANDTVWII